MPGFPDILTALKARLAAVVGAGGKVHEYVRWTDEGPDSESFRTLFASADRLHVWTITRPAAPTVRQGSDDDDLVIWRHAVEIQGFYALKDSAVSETAFRTVVDAVVTDLVDGDRSLGGACLTYSLPVPGAGGHATFMGVLCHTAQLNLTVEEVY